MTKKILIALCTLSLFQNTSTEPPTKTVRFANPIAMAIPEKALAPQVTTKQIDSAIKSFISEVTSWYEATQSAVEGDMDSLKEKSEISKAMAGLWKFHPDNPTDRSPELTYGPKKKQGTINLQNLKPSVYESINERYEGNVKRWFTDEIANFYRWQNRIKELGEEEAAKQLKNIYNAIGKELPNLLSTRSKIQTGNPLTIDEATRAVRIVNETILRTSIHKQVKISRKIVDLVLETLGLDGKPKSEQSAEKLRRLFPAKNGFQDGVEIAKLELKKYKLAIEATKFQKIIEDIDIKKSEAPGLQNKGEITKRKSKKDKLAIEVTRLQKIIKEIDFKESEAQGVWKQIIEFTAENPAEKSSDFHKAIDSARRAEAALFMHNRLLLGRSAAGQKSPIELIKTGTQEGMVEMQTDAIEYLKSWRREAKKAKEFMNSYRIQLAKIEAEEAEAKKARAKKPAQQYLAKSAPSPMPISPQKSPDATYIEAQRQDSLQKQLPAIPQSPSAKEIKPRLFPVEASPAQRNLKFQETSPPPRSARPQSPRPHRLPPLRTQKSGNIKIETQLPPLHRHRPVIHG